MLVDIFIPCEIDQFEPEIGMKMVELLQQVGCTVHYHPEQTCCGRMAFELGNWKVAKKMGEKIIATFTGNRPVVSPSLSCVQAIKRNYKILFHNTAFHNEYQQLESKVVEFTDFVHHQLHVTDFGATFPHRVLLIDEGNTAATELLSNVHRLTLIDHPPLQHLRCGNDISATHEAIAEKIAQHAIEEAKNLGAEYITSTNFETLRYLNHYLKKEASEIRTTHIINILSSKS